MTEIISKIPARIKNAAVGGHVCGTEDIIDDVKNKTQQQINNEVEESLGRGGSVDERISAAKAEIIGDAASDYNTLGKLEDKVQSEATRAEAAEEQLRTLYNNLQQSQPIPVTSLPATGEAGKIYRLAGTTSYADYMYAEEALTTPIKMAEYNNAIDDEPVTGSENLVKSGGVAKNIIIENASEFDNIITDYGDIVILNNKFINYNDGEIGESNGYACTDYIKCVSGDILSYNLFALGIVAVIVFYDKDKNYLKNESIAGANGATIGTVTVPSNAVYMRLSYNERATYSCSGKVITSEDSLKDRFLDVENDMQETKCKKIVKFNDILTEYSEIEITNDYFIDNNNIPSASNGYRYTSYIQCVAGDLVVFKLVAIDVVSMISCYDKNKNFLKNISVSGNADYDEQTFTIPTGVEYLRFSYNNEASHYVKMNVVVAVQTPDKAVQDIREDINGISARIQNLNAPFIYSAFGDSISTDEIVGDSYANPNSHADGLAYPRIIAKDINATLDRYTIPGTSIEYMKTTCLQSSPDAKLVTVMYGINSVERQEIGDLSTIMAADLATLENDTTFMGMYRWCLETLRNRLTDPNALICCISPCTNYTLDNPDGSRRSQWLIDLRATIKEFVKLEGGPNAGWYYIDGTDILPWDALYFIGTTNVPDSTHPNSMGEAIMAHGILNRLPNINLFVSRK